MKSILVKEIEKNQGKPFIVLNENAQVFCGLKQGYPDFSDNFDDAKPLSNDRQLNMIQRGTYLKLEKHYV